MVHVQDGQHSTGLGSRLHYQFVGLWRYEGYNFFHSQDANSPHCSFLAPEEHGSLLAGRCPRSCTAAAAILFCPNYQQVSRWSVSHVEKFIRYICVYSHVYVYELMHCLATILSVLPMP